MQVEYLKQVIKSFTNENKSKDKKIKILLHENIALKRRIKEKEKVIETLTKDHESTPVFKEIHKEVETQEAQPLTDEILLVGAALDRITEHEAYKDIDESTKSIG